MAQNILGIFLKNATCHACGNTINRGLWFCKVCGRSRGFNGTLQFKKWELLVASAVSSVIIYAVIITISTLMIGLRKVSPVTSNQSANPSPSPLISNNSNLSQAPATKIPTNTRIPQATNTPGDSGFVNYSCPDKSQVKLRVGQRAIVSYYDMNLRSSPIVPDVWDENIIIMLRESDTMSVIGGPVCAYDGTWWEVQTDNGYTGWAREMQPNKILLEPIK